MRACILYVLLSASFANGVMCANEIAYVDASLSDARRGKVCQHGKAGGAGKSNVGAKRVDAIRWEPHGLHSVVRSLLCQDNDVLSDGTIMLKRVLAA